MPWWGWFLTGAGTVVILEALIIGVLYLLGKSIASLQNAID